jgi:predicted metal-dependent peptidase
MSHQDPIIDKIIVARIGLLMRHPFFGNMATRMRLIDASDWCQTAATDFRNLFYNREFFELLTTQQIEFVIAHELLHCAFEHLMRRDNRDPKIWNIACDYSANGILVRDKIGAMPTHIKCFHDPKYYGMSSEEVYDHIYKKYDDDELDQLGTLLDEHIDMDGNGTNDSNNGPSNYTKEDLRQIRDEIKEAMIQASQAAGSVPGEIGRLIGELTEPKMNWREIIRQHIQSLLRDDYTWTRPSRKGWHTGVVLPGLNFTQTIDICIALDMSGSISHAQANDFLSEVKGIVEEFKDFNLKLWCFDTKVYNEQEFDGYNAEEISEYKIVGGGGTEFDANWNYMKEHDIVPKKFIMFTDGYPWGSWGDENYCDTIFIIHGSESIVPPFGEYAYYGS